MATAIWCLVLVLAVLLAGSRGIATAAPTAAVALVGGDGLTTWYADGPDTATATWARVRGGLTMATSGPDALGWWVVVTQLNEASTDLARFSWVAGTSAAQGDEVFSLVNGEVRREVISENGVGRVYRGGRLELPADVRDGSTWTSQGAVSLQEKGTLGDGIPYTSRGTATKASDPGLAASGCLDVAVDEIVSATTEATRRTWCPNRGIVRFTQGRHAFAVADAPTAALPITATAFAWERAAELTTSTTMLTPRGTQLSPNLVTRPGVLPGGRLVAAFKQANDVVAIDPDSTGGNLDRTAWRAHPGGVIQTFVTIGELTVVTTSERRVVAYGPSGIALWATSLPDTASGPAVTFGDTIVIATVDGTVQALSPGTGRQVWRVSLPGEARLRPAVSGGTLVAADGNGTIVALGADGHEVWRTSDLPVEAYAISGGVVITVEHGATKLRGYDLATGAKLWRAWEPALIRAMADVDGVLVADSTDGVRAFDPATGTLLWSNEETRLDTTVIGDRVVFVTADSVVVLDRAGHEAARWAHGLTRLPQVSVSLAAGPDSLVAVTFSELFRGVLP